VILFYASCLALVALVRRLVELAVIRETDWLIKDFKMRN
jgi:hypothetical protein